MRLWRRKRNGSPTRSTMKRGNCSPLCISPWRELLGTWPHPRVAGSRQSAASWINSDDGIGFDVPAALNRKGDKGLGLIGIRERLNAIGGAYRIISAPGQGTTLQVEIPLEAQDATQDPVSR